MTGPQSAAIDPRVAMQRRRPGLDLLRALAIVMVVLYHAGLFDFVLPFDAQRFGWIGVDLFFVLSGYLIAGQLFARIAADKQLNVSRFYARRALRILPAYFVIVAIYFFLPPALRDYERMPPLWKFLSFTQNFGLRGGTAFSHAWSLCVEFQFYLVLPLLVLGLARLARRGIPRSSTSSSSGVTTAIFVTLACAPIVWCLLIRGILAHKNLTSPRPSFGWWQQWIYYPTYARLDALTIGVDLAAIESFRRTWWNALMKSAPWIWLPGLAAIVAAMILSNDGLRVTSSVLGFFLVAFGMGTFLVCAVSPRLPISHVAIPGAAFIATIAYSVYLSHKLMIHWTESMRTTHQIGAVPAYLIMLASIFVAGSALFFAVERPFLKIRQRVTRRGK